MIVSIENKLEITVKLWLEHGSLASDVQLCLLAQATEKAQLLRNTQEKRRMNRYFGC